MKRDMDLIRELMLRLEAYPLPSGGVGYFTASDEAVSVSGYTYQQIDAHLSMVDKSGFIETSTSRPSHGISFKGLTWEGHDFVDSVRDPEIWAQTKKGAEKVGGFTVDVLTALAKGLIKEKVKKHTGVELEF